MTLEQNASPATSPASHGRVDPAPPSSLEMEPRPHRNLLVYYFLGSLALGPFFLFAAVPLYFRFRSLRYRFDEEGVSMSWGVLFRREISLTYARIQDIHLSSNLLERWLGLAKLQVQTASGSSGAEMTIEGLVEFEQVRDFLYSRMRGVRGGREADAMELPPGASPAAGGEDELTRALRAVAEEMRALREDMVQRQVGR